MRERGSSVGAESAPTRPVGSGLSWDEYCRRVGVDATAARRATLTAALWALVGGAAEAGDVPRFGAEPGEEPGD